MKRVIFFFMGIGFFSLMSLAVFAQVDSDIQKHPSCKYCGMDRKQFAHSKMFVEYEDGSASGTCSLRCMAVEFALQIDKTPKAIQVGDYPNQTLIDAEKAIWILGGDEPGVMTRRAKWAFQSKEKAERFIKEHGGALVNFEDAMKNAYEDMYADTKQIRERKRMRKMRMEQKK